jgi:hypothetical protein
VQSTLLGDIQKHLLAEHNKPTDRRTDILHPSEMAKVDWCPRQSYYRISDTPTTDHGEKFSFQMETIWAEGHEIHRKWQQWLRDMGRLWGTWQCGFCDERWADTSPIQCPRCEGRNLTYLEVPLVSTKYPIAGFEDGADAETNSLIEIKSIGMGTLRMEEPALLREYRVETLAGKKIYDLEALWSGLKHPLLSHRRQTGIYLALAKEMGLPYDKITFLYEYKATQSVKAFTIKYNDELIQPLLDSATDVKYALTSGTPPVRPPHTGKDKTVCKNCPWLRKCWDEDKDDVPLEDGLSTKDTLQTQPRVHRRKYSNRQKRSTDLSNVQPTEVQEGSDTSVVSPRTARTERGNRRLRQSRETKGLQTLLAGSTEGIRSEERAESQSVSVREEVRDNTRGLRTVTRRSRKSVQDLPGTRLDKEAVRRP